MRTIASVLFGLLWFAAGLISPYAVAQDEVVMQPVRGGPPIFDLDRLAMAKFDNEGGQPQLIVLVKQYRVEKRTVQVQKFRVEQRERTVDVQRGEKSEKVIQTYTVHIPFQVSIETKVPVAAGNKPVAISFEKLRLYRLDGTLVAPQDAAELLATLRPVFVASLKDGGYQAPERMVQHVINPQTLVVLTDAVSIGTPPVLTAEDVLP
ncbi:MAG: hypothetical protein R3C53_08325 [Pirellulaceae bacterium]